MDRRKDGVVQRGRKSDEPEEFPLRSLLANAARQVSVDITAHEGDGDAHHAENHTSRHASGGADPLKLDDLAAPDDNTDLNASSAKHGLLPKLSNVVTEFLNGQGGWTTPSATVSEIEDVGTAETDTALVLHPDGAGGVAWGADGGSGSGLTKAMMSVALHAGADGSFVTTNVNSTSYVQIANWTVFRVDFSVLNFTHFRIQGRMQANAAANTVTLQLAEQADPTTALSAAGDDLVVTNTASFFDSGWVAFASTPTTAKLLVLAAKGSSATVDLSTINVWVDFKLE